MSDRIAVMNRGVVEQLAAPEEVYERPRTEFVAGLHRRLEPDARAGRVGRRRPGASCASTAGPRCATRGDGVQRGRALPRGRAPGEAEVAQVEEPAPAGQPSVEGVVEAAVYLGTATQMVVQLAGDVRAHGAGAERRRGRAPAAARRRRARCDSRGRRSTCTWWRRTAPLPGGSGSAMTQQTPRRSRSDRPREIERRETVSNSNDWDIERAIDAMTGGRPQPPEAACGTAAPVR